MDEMVGLVREGIRELELGKEESVHINEETKGFIANGHFGTWHTVEAKEISGELFYRMEHEEYGDSVASIIVNQNGELTGCPEGIPVITSGGDQQCGAIGDYQEEYEAMKDCDKDFRMVKGGYFVLVSNIETTPSQMLASYFGRTDIEKVFKTAKEYLELLPLNKWTDDTVRGKILHDIIDTTIVLLMRKELEESGISVPDIAGATQSLMCFRDEKGNVTVETPNKKVKEYYKQMGIKIPSHLVVDEFCEKILLL